MIRRQRAAVAAGALLAVGAAAACELVLREHRSGVELAALALDPARPAMRVGFTHSVLGTPVEDRYEWRAHAGRWRAHLVEERFEGQGYGLPNAAGPGEVLERDGTGWRLRLDRVVDPLVMPTVQQMSVSAGAGPELALHTLSPRSIELTVRHCRPQ